MYDYAGYDAPTVKSHRVYGRLLRSWIMFLLAIGILAGIWYLCYMAVDTFAEGFKPYFKWGAIGASALGVLILVFNEPLVVLALGARRVEPKDERKLWQAVVRATPIHARPYPRVYLIPDPGCNAMAFGWGLPFLSAVAATDGIIRELDDEEMAGVMAHEMGHIINKDILVSTILSISVMIMAFTGWLLMRIGPYGSNRKSSEKKNSGNIAVLIAVAIGFVLYIMGRVLGQILILFISREREYAADATSAKIMGSPAPLISALQKISDQPSISSSTVASAAFGIFCTADPSPEDLMATHPSLEDRIEALEALAA